MLGELFVAVSSGIMTFGDIKRNIQREQKGEVSWNSSELGSLTQTPF